MRVVKRFIGFPHGFRKSADKIGVLYAATRLDPGGHVHAPGPYGGDSLPDVLGGESAGDLSDVPLEHLADRGSDSFAKDMMISILQNSEAEVHDIDTALAKLDGGTYGACETCGGQIGMGRLKALPFARLCIECKQVEESEAQEA